MSGMDSILDAMHQAALAHPGKMPALAKAGHMQEQAFRNRMSGDKELQVRDLMLVVTETNDVSPMDELCAALGGRFVTRVDNPLGSLLQAVVQADKEHGYIGAAISKALSDDGIIDDQEAQTVLLEIAQARRSLDVLESSIRHGAV